MELVLLSRLLLKFLLVILQDLVFLFNQRDDARDYLCGVIFMTAINSLGDITKGSCNNARDLFVPMWDVSDSLGMVLRIIRPIVYDIIQSLMPIMKRRTTNSMVAKLVVARSSYYVWQEQKLEIIQKRSPRMVIRLACALGSS
ncbi:hypothetical protein Tco_0782471 [Tanacetum coccineum]